MIDLKADLKALQKQVKLVEDDLRPRGLEDARLKVEWRAATSAERTAATFETWLGERVTQVAVAWVLSSVFVRFCEDNGLIEYPFITGPGDRAALARDLQDEFYQKHPESDDRGWLEEAFGALSVSPVAAGLFDKRHNPMWTLPPSPHAVKALLEFWRQTGPDGEIVYDFTDPEWNTRFLGDLYQDLSEHAKKTYALLQTPEFVEEFILKYTLTPAIDEFGLEPEPWGYLRVIDPACGSGHFLLGAFRKLLSVWETKFPSTDKYDLVARALKSVHGVDKNPFAVAIARFRLMLAAMKAADVKRLTEQADFPLNIAVGDSLLHGKGAPGRQGEFDFGNGPENHTYRTEDVDDYIKSAHILEAGSYHVVVANPPYITPKDEQENENYRRAYPSSYMQYALSAPFAERIFQLAIRDVGFTGQITANSFMKREFGKKLIEEFFAQKVDLTRVIDTSGAYIPGHGTPTVILIGRRRFPRSSSTIRAVLGIRGEPSQPSDPERGFVWQAIIAQVDNPGSQSEWVNSDDLEREHFSKHPWRLGGGGTAELFGRFELAPKHLADQIETIGRTTVVGEDDAWVLPSRMTASRHGALDRVKEFVIGDSVRDFAISEHPIIWNPYVDEGQTKVRDSGDLLATRILWPARAILERRKIFGRTLAENGRPWYVHLENYTSRLRTSLSISFAFVATHNHFVLDRGGKVFKQSAPVIKLPEGASEDDHLALLGVLNSSTACFWLKQVSQGKSGSGIGRGVQDEEWENRYEFTGTKLEEFPLPAELSLERGRELDSFARRLAAVEPSVVCEQGVPTRNRLDAARAEHERIRGRMIALQEELDWDVYHRYGLISDEEKDGVVTQAPSSVPEIGLGERAFEIVLGRRVARGEAETQWFARHRSTPITEVPERWPQEYRRVVARRIELIERDRNIGLIERPECKRRWQAEPWEARERAALTTWLLDRCEERSLWYDGGEPRPMTVNRLADRLRADADVVSVARLLKGPDADLGDVLREIIDIEHVPFVAQYRYKPSGLDKRRQWEATWDLQRKEDAEGRRLDIAVPPKYASADFARNSYWRHRGKLDVPKERFVSYPDASPDSDRESLLIGWAGWDHREQAAALIALIEDRSSTDGWGTDRVTGLLAGLLEIMPWVRQWHGETDPTFGQSYADAYDGYLTSQRESRSLTEEDLRAWSPPKRPRARRPRS